MSGKERLDKVLFFAGAMKSRTLAQKFIAAGAVRVNGTRTYASDHQVGAGDVLTMTLHDQLLVWRIITPGTRRGPATEAADLYQDLSPPPLPRARKSAFDAAIAEREPGSGRPLHKQRRATGPLPDDDR